MTPPFRQLPLDLPHAESRSRADFLESCSNAQALAMIDAWPDWPARTLALIGPQGAGKSHLGAVLAERAGAATIPAAMLRTDGVPEALATGALVLEDLDAAPFDEAALFHLLNLAGEQRAFLLITARHAPAALADRLATRDLASRLRALPTASIGAPDDALLAAVTLKLFADRQIVPDDALLAFLLARVERSVAAMRETVAALDREALARKRAPSRALAAELLRAQGDDAEG
ncbi:MAG TPA: chromosomal replication initiator DnaA [Xanthobacteraceae bacterium]|nr:chromosomal replication initiator DnaA [Xanthobacteraceae bacterium]